MKRLSLQGSALPSLCATSRSLPAGALALIDGELVPRIPTHLSEQYWDIIGILDQILLDLPLTRTGSVSSEDARTRVLAHVRELMHGISSLKEYLGKVLGIVLPSTARGATKVNAEKSRLENEVRRLFKAPINLVKHDGFKLYWLERS